MSMFTWRTEMRASGYSGEADEEVRTLKAARAADRLGGQAAMKILDGDRVQLFVKPDAGTFASEVVISADDARALARVITERFG